MVLTRRLNGNSASKGQGERDGDAATKRERRRRTPTSTTMPSKSPALSASKVTLSLLFAAYSVVFSLALASLFAFKPRPLPSSSPPTLFSEENAMRDVFALAGGGGSDGSTPDDVASTKRSSRAGERQLATPGCDRAASHLERRVAELAEAAREAGLDAEWESRVSTGGVDSSFLHFPFSNVFLGVRNVALRLSPRVEKGGVTPPAVLVGSHYDSALGSPGAADAAVPIAVALEVARVVVEASRGASPRPPLRAPLLLLLNGGEESLMLGSAAFMLEGGGGDSTMEAMELSSPSSLSSSSERPRWRDSVGVAFNLESTGADGPHFMFQHAGSFPLRAWRRGSARPRGTVIAQDFFDAGLSPAATDFECFAAPSPAVVRRERERRGDAGAQGRRGREGGGDLPCAAAGTLPGLDVALMLGAEVYHTFMDNPRRLRPGTVQAMGADAVGVVWELADALASATEALSSSSNSSSPLAAADVVASMGDPSERFVYFDVLGLLFVSYSRGGTGMVLHTAPLALSVALAAAFVSAVGGGGKAPPPPPLRRPSPSISAAVAAASLSALGSVLFPALLGASLAALTRRPMGWFGSGGGLGLVAFAPAAVAGALAPYSLLVRSTPPAKPIPLALLSSLALLGAALVSGAGSAVMARAGYSSCYVLALWSSSASAASLVLLLSFLSSKKERRARGEEGGARAREGVERNGDGASDGGREERPPSLAALLVAVAFLSIPAVVTSPDALVLALHILQKASFAGAPLSGRFFRSTPLVSELLSYALSDAAAGAVVGASLLSAVGGAPALAASAMMTMGGPKDDEKEKERTKDVDVDGGEKRRPSRPSALGRASFSLAALSASVLLLCSFLRDPHSPEAPKKVFVQLFHGLSDSNSSSSPSTADAVVSSSRWIGAGVDAVPSSPFLPPELGPWQPDPGAGRGGVEWLSLFPLGEILETTRGKEVDASPSRPPPTLSLLSRSPSPSSVDEERLELALDVSDPEVVSRGVFGALNVTGNVLRWSLTPSFSSPLPSSTPPPPSSSEDGTSPLPPSPPSSPRPWRIVRFGGVPPHVAEEAKGEKRGTKKKSGERRRPYWRFWIDVPKDTAVSISAAVSTVGLRGSEEIDALFGDSVSATLIETWGGQWEFF